MKRYIVNLSRHEGIEHVVGLKYKCKGCNCGSIISLIQHECPAEDALLHDYSFVTPLLDNLHFDNFDEYNATMDDFATKGAGELLSLLLGYVRLYYENHENLCLKELKISSYSDSDALAEENAIPLGPYPYPLEKLDIPNYLLYDLVKNNKEEIFANPKKLVKNFNFFCIWHIDL